MNTGMQSYSSLCSWFFLYYHFQLYSAGMSSDHGIQFQIPAIHLDPLVDLLKLPANLFNPFSLGIDIDNLDTHGLLNVPG